MVSCCWMRAVWLKYLLINQTVDQYPLIPSDWGDLLRGMTALVTRGQPIIDFQGLVQKQLFLAGKKMLNSRQILFHLSEEKRNYTVGTEQSLDKNCLTDHLSESSK